MSKVRVPIINTIGKSVRIEENATVGATITLNLKDPDGNVLSVAGLAELLGVVQAEDIGVVAGATATDHGLLTGLADDDHPQYAEIASPESITAIWDFVAQPTGIDHASLDLLLADDHTQYLLLAGRAGGQSAFGGTAAGDILDLTGADAAPDAGIVRVNSPVTFTYDTVSNALMDFAS